MIGAILADLRPVVRGADRALTLPLSPGWFPVGARVASKSSNSASEGHIVHAIQVRLSFVFDVPFFVFNDMVASIVVLLFIFGSEPARVPGLARQTSRLTGRRYLPTTMCPQNDHNYRLACIPEFVK